MDSSDTNRNLSAAGSTLPVHSTGTQHNGDGLDARSTKEAQISQPSYSVFTKAEKWVIVALASYASVFSPLTANIYFPAIPTLAHAFHTSIENINLTVTVYMVMQGVAPMFWGSIADKWGRRPIFLACMLVLCGSCVGLALVPTNAYWLLVVLRLLQAGGSASTVALAAGVVSDIATPSERGGFLALSSLGAVIGPSVGPIIGGALTQGLGWRSIFWFLAIASAFSLLLFIAILPETLRSIVGNGSIPPPRIYRPPFPVVGGRYTPGSVDRPPAKRFVSPFGLFLYPDLDLLLVFFGVIYMTFYGVTATLSTLFKRTYPFLNETDLGLLFLPITGGLAIGTVVIGKVLDAEYRRIRGKLVRKWVEAQEAAGEKVDEAEAEREATKEENFPIERARLRLIPIMVAVFAAAVLGYGWSLQRRAHIAVPLVLQFIMGLVTAGIMNNISTIMVDLAPGRGSSVTACNNLVRCSLGAIGVSVMDPLLNALGEGWTYIFLGGLCIATLPFLYIVMRCGPGWRAKRRQAATQK